MVVLAGKPSKSRESMSRSLLFKPGPPEEEPSLLLNSDLLPEWGLLLPDSLPPLRLGGLIPFSDPLSEEGDPPALFLLDMPEGEPDPEPEEEEEDPEEEEVPEEEEEESCGLRLEAEPPKSPGLWDLTA